MLNLKNAKRNVSQGLRRQSEPLGSGESTGLLSQSRQSSSDSGSGLVQNFRHAVSVILFENYVNILLVFVPLGILAELLNWSPVARFTLNFFAIIPLASLLSFATEELALQVGESLGGLLNASFGNAVELIVSVIALTKGEIRIVQASMLGSILSNILLVLGMCFAAGGFYYQEQEFNMTVAQTMSSLMAVGTSALLLPAAFHLAIPTSIKLDEQILFLSRGTAIILLIIYGLYLFFQLKTHASAFQASEDTEETSKISPWTAGAMLVGVTVLVSFCADFLVGSIDEIVEETGISKTFVGLILIPIVGNAAEHVTAVICSIKGRINLAIGVSLGSAIQISLFMTPFLVVLGWIIGQPMTLYFKSFETITMFVAVLIVNYLIQDGKSNWLEGAQLMAVYAIIAIAFYIYPDSVAE